LKAELTHIDNPNILKNANKLGKVIFMLQTDNKTNMKLVRPNRLAKEIVIADGIGSSGKGMLSHIIASFKRVEKQRNDMIFDTIPRMYMWKKISHDAAITLMQLEADQQLYHTMMSRAVNFRPKDSTGVLQNPFPWKYFKRLLMQEGDKVIERINKEKPIFNNAPHWALKNAEILFDAFEENLKIVFVVRDPIEIVHDWYIRGFGSRIGVDPREFQFTYEKNGLIFPEFADGWEDKFLTLTSPVEKIIHGVNLQINGYIESYKKLSGERQKRVMFVLFDELISDSILVSEKIAEFIGTVTTKQTKRTLKREGCPRKFSTEKKMQKKKELEKEIQQYSLDTLNNMSFFYNSFVKEYSLNKQTN